MFEATRRCQDQVCGPVSSFLVLFAGYSGTGGSNCPFKCCWQWTKLVYYEHVCVCFISSQLSSDFTSQSRDPELVVLVQGIMQYTGLQQCMALCRCCACVAGKQVGSGLDGLTEIYFHPWRTRLAAMWLPFSSLSLLYCSPLPFCLLCYISLLSMSLYYIYIRGTIEGLFSSPPFIRAMWMTMKGLSFLKEGVWVFFICKRHSVILG